MVRRRIAALLAYAVLASFAPTALAQTANFPGALYEWTEPTGSCNPPVSTSGCITKAMFTQASREIEAIEEALGVDLENLKNQVIQDEGVDLVSYGALNFVGTGVTCAADAGNERVTCTFTGGGGGSSITFDTTADAVDESEGLTHLECSGDGLACTEPDDDEARIALSIGTGATQVAAGNHTHAQLHDAVTLAGTPDYITLSGQVITRGLIDLATDTTGNLDDDVVAFDDGDSNWTATTLGAALEELDEVNGSGPNAGDGKVEWSQLVGVPADFADGTDDGAGGGGTSVALDLADDGSDESSALTEIAVDNDTNSVFTEPSANKLLIDLAADWPKADTADDLTCTNCISGTEIDESGLTIDDDTVAFDDADSNWTATTIGAALEELDDVINSGSPNDAAGKVDWSQLVNVPAGFADNSDDGAGGGGSPGGTGTQLQYRVDGSTFGGMAGTSWDNTNKRLAFTGMTTSDDGTAKMFSIAGTLPTTPSTTAYGEEHLFTGAGSASQAQIGALYFLQAGYTGSAITRGYHGANASAGTGTDLLFGNASQSVVNEGVFGNAIATTTGINVGVAGDGQSSTTANIGVLGKSVSTAAGSNYGGVFHAASSTEATDPKNIALLASLGTDRISGSQNGSFGIYVDGGTLPDANSRALYLKATHPSSPSASVYGLDAQVTSAGSAAQVQGGMNIDLNAGYTGSAHTVALRLANSVAGTGSALSLNSSGGGAANYGAYLQAIATTTGGNAGAVGLGQGSSAWNVGFLGKANSAVAGTNIGLLGNASSSTEATDPKNIGVLGTLHSALPTGQNGSFAGYFDGGTLPDAISRALYVKATLPSSPSAGAYGIEAVVTGAGTALQDQVAAWFQLAPGYTGANGTAAVVAYNQSAASAGTFNLSSGTGTAATFGFNGVSTGSGSGINIGGQLLAAGSTGSNVGALMKSAGASAGTNYGFVSNAANSTEDTGPLNVGGAIVLASGALPTANASYGLWVDAGTLPNRLSRVLSATGTLPAVPSGGSAIAYTFGATSAGSASLEQTAFSNFLLGGYTGSSSTTAATFENQAKGTAANAALSTFTGFAANFGVRAIADQQTVGTGASIALSGDARKSSAFSAGVFGRAIDSQAGSNFGVIGNAANSVEGTDLVNVAVLGTTASSLPAINASFSGLFDGSPVGLWNQTELRFYEGSAGANHVIVKAPASLTGDRTCTLQDDSTPFDDCVTGGGGGTPVWNVLTKTTDYAILSGDMTGKGALVICDTSSGAVTLTLPAATTSGGDVRVKREGANACTVSRAGSDTIYDGAAVNTKALTSDGQSQDFTADGSTTWHVS